MSNYRFYFAQAYGQGSYSGCTYNNSCTETGAGTASGTNSQLANTGFDILVLATIACLLIFAALAVRLWRKKRSGSKASSAQSPKDGHDHIQE